MRVDDLMSSAKCLKAEDTVRDCARLMRDENIGFVPVCDAEGKPVGAITDRDLAIRVLAEGRTGDEPIEAYITRETFGCRLGDDAEDAERTMREHQVSRVMVCDEEGRLEGVISLQDLSETEDEETAGRTLSDVKSEQPSVH